MKININDLKFKFHFRKDIDESDFEHQPATMTLNICDLIAIYGFKVVRAEKKDSLSRYLIYPPSKSLGHDKWFDYFRAESTFWKQAKQKAINQFENEFTDYLNDLEDINNCLIL